MNGGGHRYSNSGGRGGGMRSGGGGGGGGGGGRGGRSFFGGGRRGGGRRGGRHGSSGSLGGSGGQQDSSLMACFNFLSGKCHYQDSCRFSHGLRNLTGMDLNAHTGAVKGLGIDTASLYSVGDDGVIKTYSYVPGSGINPAGSHTGRGPGTFFICSEPSKQFYFTAYTTAIFHLDQAHTYPHLQTGQVQMTYKGTNVDLHISEERPYADARCVNAITAWEIADSAGNPMPHVFTGGEDGAIRVWNIDPATTRFKVVATLEGHTRGVTALLVISSGADAMLFSSSSDGTVRAWNAQTYAAVFVIGPVGLCKPGSPTPAEPQQGHGGPITHLIKITLDDTSFLCTASLDGCIMMWHLTGAWAGQTQHITDTNVGGVTHIAQVVKGTEQYLISATSNGYLVVWLLPSLEIFCMVDARNVGKSSAPPLPPQGGYQQQQGGPAAGGGGTVQVTSLLPLVDGVFVTGCSDGSIKCWTLP